MTLRADRMVNSAPYYYQYSNVYRTIQEAQGDEYDSLEVKNEDLRKQLFIVTATWGLKYWEQVLGISTILADSYDIRRSRVLSKWRGVGNFSVALIKSISEAFTDGEVGVTIDIPGQVVTITFIGTKGIPENLDDLKAQIENLVHAHLGTQYILTYLTWDELDTYNKTWDQWDALGLTWDEFEKYNT